jgi:hypothetical protein
MPPERTTPHRYSLRRQTGETRYDDSVNNDEFVDSSDEEEVIVVAKPTKKAAKKPTKKGGKKTGKKTKKKTAGKATKEATNEKVDNSAIALPMAQADSIATIAARTAIPRTPSPSRFAPRSRNYIICNGRWIAADGGSSSDFSDLTDSSDENDSEMPDASNTGASEPTVSDATTAEPAAPPPAPPMSFEDLMAHPDYPPGTPYRLPGTDPAFNIEARGRLARSAGTDGPLPMVARTLHPAESMAPANGGGFTMLEHHAHLRNYHNANVDENYDAGHFNEAFEAIETARYLDARAANRRRGIYDGAGDDDEDEEMHISYNFESGSESGELPGPVPFEELAENIGGPPILANEHSTETQGGASSSTAAGQPAFNPNWEDEFMAWPAVGGDFTPLPPSQLHNPVETRGGAASSMTVASYPPVNHSWEDPFMLWPAVDGPFHSLVPSQLGSQGETQGGASSSTTAAGYQAFNPNLPAEAFIGWPTAGTFPPHVPSQLPDSNVFSANLPSQNRAMARIVALQGQLNINQPSNNARSENIAINKPMQTEGQGLSKKDDNPIPLIANKSDFENLRKMVANKSGIMNGEMAANKATFDTLGKMVADYEKLELASEMAVDQVEHNNVAMNAAVVEDHSPMNVVDANTSSGAIVNEEENAGLEHPNEEDDDSLEDDDYASSEDDDDTSSEDDDDASEADEELPHFPDTPIPAWLIPIANHTVTEFVPIDPFSKTIPLVDTSPTEPFAPWHASDLPSFIPERANRVVVVPGRFLSGIGNLYPAAQFYIAAYPASRTKTVKMTGETMAMMMAVNFPGLRPTDLRLAEGGEFPDRPYIIALIQRDWPVGGVAMIPKSDEANAIFEEVKQAFDIMPRGEVWSYLSYVMHLRAGGEERGVLVCRGYEGRKGEQPDKVLEKWCAENAHGLGQDEEGRRILAFMGEAAVEPDWYPKPTKAAREALERERAEARRRAAEEAEEDEDEE